MFCRYAMLLNSTLMRLIWNHPATLVVVTMVMPRTGFWLPGAPKVADQMKEIWSQE